MDDRQLMQVWMMQKQIVLPQLLFQHYKALQMMDDEALMIFHVMSFLEEGIEFPTPENFAARTHFHVNDISLKLQRLMQKGFLEITQGHDLEGKMTEKFSLAPLWQRLFDMLVLQNVRQEQVTEKMQEGEIFKMFEQEFGRLLSPIELETITMWLDQDKHSPMLIKAALREAVLAGKMSLRYIDRILFEWKKKNITSVAQVEQHSEKFRKVQAVPQQEKKPTNSGMFYNWLDERE